jgi:hypothetical protein
LTPTFDEVADAVREATLGRQLSDAQRAMLVGLGFATVAPFGDLGDMLDTMTGARTPTPVVTLTPRGDAFDEAWTVFGNREPTEALLRDAFLGLRQTEALIQGLHGRPPVRVDGALHLLARHGLADPTQVTEFRAFLQRLNDLDIVAYSKKAQTVRITTPVPVEEETEPTVRVIERDRPYSNVVALRRTLRACSDHIWWVDAHFSRKGLEPLTDEADATRVTEIHILSGPAQVGAETGSDFKRFQKEMATLGIEAEWRVIERSDQEFHDRFIVTKGKAWNVPPVNTLYKGDYSEITATTAPPFETWWARGKPLQT